MFLKTAFEALTGTNKSHESATFLRELFEAVPNTSPDDSDLLVWSPAEKAIYTRTYEKKGKQCTAQIRLIALSQVWLDLDRSSGHDPATWPRSNPLSSNFSSGFRTKRRVRGSCSRHGGRTASCAPHAQGHGPAC